MNHPFLAVSVQGHRLFKCSLVMMADSDDVMGLNHATILASKKASLRNISFWAAPLLSAHEPVPVANDQELGAWTYDWLEKLIERAQ